MNTSKIVENLKDIKSEVSNNAKLFTKHRVENLLWNGSSTTLAKANYQYNGQYAYWQNPHDFPVYITKMIITTITTTPRASFNAGRVGGVLSGNFNIIGGVTDTANQTPGGYNVIFRIDDSYDTHDLFMKEVDQAGQYYYTYGVKDICHKIEPGEFPTIRFVGIIDNAEFVSVSAQIEYKY